MLKQFQSFIAKHAPRQFVSRSFSPILDCLDPEELNVIVLDYDETLVFDSGKKLEATDADRTSLADYFEYLKKNYDWQIALQHLLKAYIDIFKTGKYAVLDPDAAETIQKLSKLPNVILLGCTARPFSTHSRVLSVIEKVLPDLYAALREHPVLTNPASNSGCDRSFIFCNHTDKGEKLEYYLRQLDIDPQNLIFVDNLKYNVDSADKVAKKNKWLFHGIHLGLYEHLVDFVNNTENTPKNSLDEPEYGLMKYLQDLRVVSMSSKFLKLAHPTDQFRVKLTLEAGEFKSYEIMDEGCKLHEVEKMCVRDHFQNALEPVSFQPKQSLKAKIRTCA